MPEPLRLVGDHSAPTRCRTRGCVFVAGGRLGYCQPCYSVYEAALELRERLLARRRARLQAAHRDMLDQLSAPVRWELLNHVAANGAAHGFDAATLDVAGLEDFLSELRELGVTE